MTDQRRLWGLLIGLAAAILVLLMVRLWSAGDAAPVSVAVADPSCDLHAGPCLARFPQGGEVTFEIEPRGIPIARPLVLRVLTRDLQATAVAVDFVGTDMYMGYNRPVLAADGPGHFRGEAMLPVCIRKRMDWEARVLLTTPAGMLAATFRFATRR